MSEFLDEAELFWKKIFGKIASPTTSCIVEREMRGICNKLLFSSFIPTYVFVRGEEKQLHP